MWPIPGLFLRQSNIVQETINLGWWCDGGRHQNIYFCSSGQDDGCQMFAGVGSKRTDLHSAKFLLVETQLQQFHSSSVANALAGSVSALIISLVWFFFLSFFLHTQYAQVWLRFSSGPLHFIKVFTGNIKTSLIWKKKPDAMKTSCAHLGDDALSLCTTCWAASPQPLSASRLRLICISYWAVPSLYFFSPSLPFCGLLFNVLLLLPH